MKKTPLYSIGHGSRKEEEFVSLLKKYGIEFLIDVRSRPYSRYHTQFNRNQLDHILGQNGIRYVFMGDTLGGRPDDPSCYDSSGKIDYDMLGSKEYFQQGIDRLKTAYEKGIKAAIMCSERNPIECHRIKLIGKLLYRDGIVLQHIDEKGEIRDQERVMAELKRGDGNSSNSLF